MAAHMEGTAELEYTFILLLFLFYLNISFAFSAWIGVYMRTVRLLSKIPLSGMVRFLGVNVR